MAIASEPTRLQTPTREKRVQDYKRDYKLRNPDASTAEGEQPDIDARLLADQLIPLDAIAQQAGDSLSLLNQSEEDLKNTYEPQGILWPAAKGASGYVTITAASAGAPILYGDELKDLNTDLRFKCLEENYAWQDGDSVPIGGVSTGTLTNLPEGTQLRWTQPRPGLGDLAVVVGEEGLTGGVERATPDEYRALVAEAHASPAASGNNADIQREGAKTPGVPFLQIFTYPAILGACTSAVVGILKPSRLGASRVPTSLQRDELEAYVSGQFPEGDIYYFPYCTEEPVDIVAEMRWAKAAEGWGDVAPWPPRRATAAGKIGVASVADATSFVLRTDNSVYTGIPAPTPGTKIAFWNLASATFVRKTVLTSTGTGPWTITCDMTFNASDPSYVPVVAQPCCPWSGSLTEVGKSILTSFEKLGPGEMLEDTYFFDDGYRRKRNPESPKLWPSVLTNKNLSDALDLDVVAEGVFVAGVDTPTPVGIPGTVVRLLVCGDITIFPKVA